MAEGENRPRLDFGTLAPQLQSVLEGAAVTGGAFAAKTLAKRFMMGSGIGNVGVAAMIGGVGVAKEVATRLLQEKTLGIAAYRSYWEKNNGAIGGIVNAFERATQRVVYQVDRRMEEALRLKDEEDETTTRRGGRRNPMAALTNEERAYVLLVQSQVLTNNFNHLDQTRSREATRFIEEFEDTNGDMDVQRLKTMAYKAASGSYHRALLATSVVTGMKLGALSFTGMWFAEEKILHLFIDKIGDPTQIKEVLTKVKGAKNGVEEIVKNNATIASAKAELVQVTAQIDAAGVKISSLRTKLSETLSGINQHDWDIASEAAKLTKVQAKQTELTEAIRQLEAAQSDPSKLGKVTDLEYQSQLAKLTQQITDTDTSLAKETARQIEIQEQFSGLADKVRQLDASRVGVKDIITESTVFDTVAVKDVNPGDSLLSLLSKDASDYVESKGIVGAFLDTTENIATQQPEFFQDSLRIATTLATDSTQGEAVRDSARATIAAFNGVIGHDGAINTAEIGRVIEAARAGDSAALNRLYAMEHWFTRSPDTIRMIRIPRTVRTVVASAAQQIAEIDSQKAVAQRAMQLLAAENVGLGRRVFDLKAAKEVLLAEQGGLVGKSLTAARKGLVEANIESGSIARRLGELKSARTVLEGAKTTLEGELAAGGVDPKLLDRAAQIQQTLAGLEVANDHLFDAVNADLPGLGVQMLSRSASVAELVGVQDGLATLGDTALEYARIVATEEHVTLGLLAGAGVLEVTGHIGSKGARLYNADNAVRPYRNRFAGATVVTF